MYKTHSVKLSELYLDEQNPRFTTREDKNFSQEEIINYLIDYEELLDLVNKINSYGGFTPGERIIAVKEGDKFVVLEGNRRTSSLKLLANPDLVKSKKINIPKISHDCAKFIQAIPIDVVNSREDADWALITRHIDGIRLWSQFSKMKFYEKMFSNGKGLDEISQMSRESNIVIKRTLQRYSILNTILSNYSTVLPNSTYLSQTVDAKLDTDLILTRMYTYYVDGDGLDLKFNEKDHTLILPTKKDKKDSLIKSLVLLAKMYWEDEVINTRILNKKTEIDDFFNSAKTGIAKPRILNETHKDFLHSLSNYFNYVDSTDREEMNGEKPHGEAPDTEKPNGEKSHGETPDAERSNGEKSHGEASDGERPKGETSDGERPKGEKSNGEKTGGKRSNIHRQSKPKNRDYPFKGIKYTGDVIGISRSLFELHRIDVSTFSLSSTVLIRTLLECTIQEYILKKQINIMVKNRTAIKELSIDSLLKTCTNDGNGNYKELQKADRLVARIINEANNKRDSDELNIVAHGNYREPSPDVLWEIERRWFSALQIMIEEISGQKN